MLKKLLQLPKKIWNWFKRQSKKKKAAVIIGLLILISVTNSILNKKDPKSAYQLEAAKIDSVTEYVSETGNITTAGSAPLYSTTTGIVEEVYVSNGDFVEKDAPLFKVKATATKQQKDAALSTYLTAKTTLESAKATQLTLQSQMFTKWDSFKELAESDDYEDADGNPKYDQRNLPEFHVPEKDWLAAEAAYKNQQQVISQAQANLSATWQAYQATQDSQVNAIFDGQIQNLAVTKGDLIEIKTATTGIPALVLIQNNVNTTIKITVSETDITKVQPGQPATVEVDAIDNKTFKAHVDRVDTIAVPTEGVVEYSVYIVLDESDQNILAGMTADVDITVSSLDNVLTVPSSAVKPYEGARAVRVVNDKGEIEYIPVEVGSRGEGLTQILSGIEEGTEVVVALTNDQVQRDSDSGGLF